MFRLFALRHGWLLFSGKVYRTRRLKQIFQGFLVYLLNMANNELLARHKGTRNVNIRSISNSEREAVDIISNFQMTDENHITKLLSIKNSVNDKLRKKRKTSGCCARTRNCFIL